ncbi:MAG: hypothetical protein HQK91_01520 [Nitrospirae bacterium]|nr:hypothetical protein [Nitrospirota bacterium]
MERLVKYFEKPGKINSEKCLEIVLDAIAQYDYKHVVIATTGGDTGLLFSEALKDNTKINLVAVTHSSGFKESNVFEIPNDTLQKIKDNGAKVYTGTILTHSLETALAGKFGGVYPTTLIAQTLRVFGEGTKVCCEIAMMAVDCGLIPEGQDVITVAGTGRGADTVLIVKSAASKRFFDLKVQEVLAKPRL